VQRESLDFVFIPERIAEFGDENDGIGRGSAHGESKVKLQLWVLVESDPTGFGSLLLISKISMREECAIQIRALSAASRTAVQCVQYPSSLRTGEDRRDGHYDIDASSLTRLRFGAMIPSGIKHASVRVLVFIGNGNENSCTSTLIVDLLN
jgi:hypothetical protein